VRWMSGDSGGGVESHRPGLVFRNRAFSQGQGRGWRGRYLRKVAGGGSGNHVGTGSVVLEYLTYLTLLYWCTTVVKALAIRYGGRREDGFKCLQQMNWKVWSIR